MSASAHAVEFDGQGRMALNQGRSEGSRGLHQFRDSRRSSPDEVDDPARQDAHDRRRVDRHDAVARIGGRRLPLTPRRAATADDEGRTSRRPSRSRRSTRSTSCSRSTTRRRWVTSRRSSRTPSPTSSSACSSRAASTPKGKPSGELADPTGNKENNFGCTAGTEPEFKPVTDMHIGIVSSSLGNFGGDVCDRRTRARTIAVTS